MSVALILLPTWMFMWRDWQCTGQQKSSALNSIENTWDNQLDIESIHCWMQACSSIAVTMDANRHLGQYGLIAFSCKPVASKREHAPSHTCRIPSKIHLLCCTAEPASVFAATHAHQQNRLPFSLPHMPLGADWIIWILLLEQEQTRMPTSSDSSLCHSQGLA